MTQSRARDLLNGCPGYQQSASGWVYVIEGERSSDGEEYFYVGKTVRRPEVRIAQHLGDHQTIQVPTEADPGYVLAGVQVIRGHGLEPDGYVVNGLERVHSLVSKPEEPSRIFAARLAEKERSTAYDVALEYSTTNVLGGK